MVCTFLTVRKEHLVPLEVNLNATAYRHIFRQQPGFQVCGRRLRTVSFSFCDEAEAETRRCEKLRKCSWIKRINNVTPSFGKRLAGTWTQVLNSNCANGKSLKRSNPSGRRRAVSKSETVNLSLLHNALVVFILSWPCLKVCTQRKWRLRRLVLAAPFFYFLQRKLCCPVLDLNHLLKISNKHSVICRGDKVTG